MTRRLALLMCLLLTPVAAHASPIGLSGFTGGDISLTVAGVQTDSLSFSDATTIAVLGFGGLFNVTSSPSALQLVFVVDVPAFTDQTIFRLGLLGGSGLIFPVTTGAPVPAFGMSGGACCQQASVSLAFVKEGFSYSYLAGDTITLSLDDTAASVVGKIPEPSTLILLALGLGVVVTTRLAGGMRYRLSTPRAASRG